MLSTKQWLMEEESVSQAYKKIRLTAFIAVVISTASVISAVIALPLLYSQLQTLQSYMTNELDFCKSKSRDLWVEMLSTQDQKGLGHRSKRAWLFGQWVADSPRPILFDPVLTPPRPSGPGNYDQKARPVGPYGVSAPSYEPNRISGGYPNILPDVDVVSGCCSCQQGPAGLPGQPGLPGNDGADGKNGTDGKPGKDGVVLPRTGPAPEACQLCPAGPPGPAGLKGPKGGPGVRGPGGEEGSKGTPGRRGPAGDRGIPGGPGAPGLNGPIGEPGKSVLKTGPDGPAGLQGLLGPAGPPGSVGLDGRPGFSGPPGDAGDPGEPGLDAKSGSPGPKGPPGPRGPPGGCGHCPPARTAPGYNPNRVAARS